MNILQPTDLDFHLTLQTEYITLRPMRDSDYSQLKLISTYPMWKYFTQNLADESQLKLWIGEALRLREKQERIPFTVLDRATNKIVGSTSFGNISERDQRIEIGWTWIGKDYHGTGINDQMKYLMFKYCFEALQYERVEAKTDVLNMPARNAMKRMGMVEEGILRSHTLMTGGRRRDTIFYSMIKKEWPQVKLRNMWP